MVFDVKVLKCALTPTRTFTSNTTKLGSAIVRVAHAHEYGMLGTDELDKIERQIRIMKRIQSPHVAELLEWGRDDFCHWYIVPMPLGLSLRHVLFMQGPRCQSQVVQMGMLILRVFFYTQPLRSLLSITFVMFEMSLLVS